MASLLPKYLIKKSEEKTDEHGTKTATETALIHSTGTDMVLLLVTNQRDRAKIPVFHNTEGKA